MSIKVGGSGTGTIAEVETNTLALRAVSRPLDWSPQIPFVGGANSVRCMAMLVGTDGLSGAQTAASVLQFRWTSPQLVCSLRRLKLRMAVNVAFTAGIITMALFPARLFSVNGTGGKTMSVKPTDARLRGVMGLTTVADIRYTSTAALSAGTWVLDADPITAFSTGVTVVNQIGWMDGDYRRRGEPLNLFEAVPGEHPFVMAANEGFNVALTLPASGAVVLDWSISWDEITVA